MEALSIIDTSIIDTSTITRGNIKALIQQTVTQFMVPCQMVTQFMLTPWSRCLSLKANIINIVIQCSTAIWSTFLSNQGGFV